MTLNIGFLILVHQASGVLLPHTLYVVICYMYTQSVEITKLVYERYMRDNMRLIRAEMS